jgi:hypothetical protein
MIALAIGENQPLQQSHAGSTSTLSAMRFGFGGHMEKAAHDVPA